MLINTVIIDDENHSLDLLNNYCQQVPQLNVLSTFTEPLKALNFINNNNVDLLITDINMPLLTGIELKESLSVSIFCNRLHLLVKSYCLVMFLANKGGG